MSFANDPLIASEVQKFNVFSSSLACKHFNDPVIKTKFTNECYLFSRDLCEQHKKGRKTKQQVINELNKEKQNLKEQENFLYQKIYNKGLEVYHFVTTSLFGETTFRSNGLKVYYKRYQVPFSKGLGVIASASQIIAGAALIPESAGASAPMIAYGFNDLYENGMYFVDGSEEHSGLLRMLFREAAGILRVNKAYGDIVYTGTDIFIGIKGYFKYSKEAAPAQEHLLIRQPWERKANVKTKKLWYHFQGETLKQYQVMSFSNVGSIFRDSYLNILNADYIIREGMGIYEPE